MDGNGFRRHSSQPATPTVLCRSAAFHLLWQLTLAVSLATASAPAPTLPWSRGTQALGCREMFVPWQGTGLWWDQCWCTAGRIMTWHHVSVYLYGSLSSSFLSLLNRRWSKIVADLNKVCHRCCAPHTHTHTHTHHAQIAVTVFLVVNTFESQNGPFSSITSA